MYIYKKFIPKNMSTTERLFHFWFSRIKMWVKRTYFRAMTHQGYRRALSSRRVRRPADIARLRRLPASYRPWSRSACSFPSGGPWSWCQGRYLRKPFTVNKDQRHTSSARHWLISQHVSCLVSVSGNINLLLALCQYTCSIFFYRGINSSHHNSCFH